MRATRPTSELVVGLSLAVGACGGLTDAVQVKCNFAGVRDTAENRADVADALAGVLVEFRKKHYGWPAA